MIDVKKMKADILEDLANGSDSELNNKDVLTLLDALEEQEAIIQDLREELRPERTAEYEAQLFHARLVEANKALEAADSEMREIESACLHDYTNTSDILEAVQRYRNAREGK